MRCVYPCIYAAFHDRVHFLCLVDILSSSSPAISSFRLLQHVPGRREVQWYFSPTSDLVQNSVRNSGGLMTGIQLAALVLAPWGYLLRRISVRWYLRFVLGLLTHLGLCVILAALLFFFVGGPLPDKQASLALGATTNETFPR